LKEHYKVVAALRN